MSVAGPGPALTSQTDPLSGLDQLIPSLVLYQGLQLLLEDTLIDWRFVAGHYNNKAPKLNQQTSETGLITARFRHQNDEWHTTIHWPLTDTSQNQQDHCSCQTANLSGSATYCIHMAALAIESQINLQPDPIADNQSLSGQRNIDYLNQWLKQQNYDPYPNMARHRVVYLLTKDSNRFRVELHKAYLTKTNQYQLKTELDRSLLTKKSRPKFFSLTDQHILAKMAELEDKQPDIALGNHVLELEFPRDLSLLELLIGSNRCFWQHCDNPPLSWQDALTLQPDNLPISEKKFLDPTNHQLVRLHTQAEIKRLTGLLAQQTKVVLTPRLLITTHRFEMPWRHSQAITDTIIQLDIARVRFAIQSIEFKLEELLCFCKLAPEPKLHMLLDQVAAFVSQLDQLPSLPAQFEQPVHYCFDICDRHLGENLAQNLVLFRALQQQDWQIVFDSQSALQQRQVGDWYSLITTGDIDSTEPETIETSWFDLELGIKLNGQKINLLPYLVHALQYGELDLSQQQDPVLFLDDGSRIQLPYQRIQNLISHLVELRDTHPLNSQHRLSLPVSQCARLLELETELTHQADWQVPDWLKQKANRLSGGSGEKVRLPEKLTAPLRQYQQEGVEWLQHLSHEGLAGILADDMGLGKTIQTLIHIQIKRNHSATHKPCLVVAPISLLDNWISEAKRFTPQLTTLRWSGPQRWQQADKLSQVDLIITSYGILLRDQEQLNALGIHLLILDEAQLIKNSRSRIAQNCYRFKASHRLCLTGTPLENHLGELWSLFHFLMPGFLGTQTQFNRLFRVPIEQNRNLDRQRALHNRVAPFILRRTKQQVAADLPKKTIILQPIELTESQADLYEAIRLSTLKTVQQALAHKHHQHLTLSNALLKLRQTCCHPALLAHSHPTAASATSAKMEWLETMLPEMIESGRRILLFSSFTTMLNLIAERLQRLNIPYLMLTGKSRDRQRLVDQFQSGDAPIFLISLKAGGTGLNLTRADTVIHFDPWWNPAAEAQASDRAHRIGQIQPVFIYKLICKGTVEEKIQTMQDNKSSLASSLYQQLDNHSLLQQLDWHTLLAPQVD